MSADLYLGFPEGLVRASIAMVIAAACIAIVLRVSNLRSPVLHRLAWMVVLVQGCIFTRVAWDVPFYDTVATSPRSLETSRLPVHLDPSKDVASLDDPRRSHVTDDAVQLSAAGSAQRSSQHESTAPHDNKLQQVSPLVADKATTGTSRTSAGDWRIAKLTSFSMVSALLTIWVLGICVLLAVHIASYTMLLFALRRAQPPHHLWSAQWRSILKRAGLQKNIPMRVHPSLGPMICRRPSGYQIVVPVELWEELSIHQRAAVLKHELAHYLRGDIWKSFLARLVALPHWFNPIAWLAVRKFDETGEWACDRYLIENDPDRVTEFAQALLRIVQFPKPAGVGFRGAGGSFLSERIRRLCGANPRGDSVVKRTLSVLLLVIVFGLGLAEIRLVARAIARETQDLQTNSNEGDSRGFETDQQRMKRFADRLVVSSEDKALGQFKSAVSTPAGQTALRERASRLEFTERQAAQENALPAFLDEHFQKDGQRLVLKNDQSNFKSSVIERTAQYQSDVDEIQDVIEELASRIGDDHEADKMLKRLLTQPMAAWVIYATEVRQRIRPDERTIQELYQGVFVVGPDGQLIIRPAVRPQIEEQLATRSARRRALPRIREELTNMSVEISDVDETHQQLRRMFADELFAAFCCYDSVRRDGNPDEGIQNLFNYMERIFEDHSDGLRLSEQGQQQSERLLASFAGRREMADRLREPLKRFVSRIPEDYDELHDKVKEAFNSELILAFLTREGNMRVTSAERSIRDTFGNQLSETDDGSMMVREEHRDQVIENVRRLLRTSRVLRRRLAAVDDQVSQIDDPQLRAVFDSVAGKYLMIRSINQQIAGQYFDGLKLWIDRHFVESEDGYVLNEDSRSEISEFLEQVNDIRAELEKDDF